MMWTGLVLMIMGSIGFAYSVKCVRGNCWHSMAIVGICLAGAGLLIGLHGACLEVKMTSRRITCCLCHKRRRPGCFIDGLGDVCQKCADRLEKVERPQKGIGMMRTAALAALMLSAIASAVILLGKSNSVAASPWIRWIGIGLLALILIATLAASRRRQPRSIRPAGDPQTMLYRKPILPPYSHWLRVVMTIVVLVVGIISLLFGFFLFKGQSQVGALVGGITCFAGGYMLSRTLHRLQARPRVRHIDPAITVMGLVVASAVLVWMYISFINPNWGK